VELLDAAPTPRGHHAAAGQGPRLLKGAAPPTPKTGDASADEPWLAKDAGASERRIVWSAEPMAGPRARAISGSVAIAGLDASVLGPAQRAAFVRAVASRLPQAKEHGVRMVRVASRSGTPGTAEVDFEATVSDNKGAMLDQIEARLILLRESGPAARRFTEELRAQLSAAGAPLPRGAVVSVAEPHQLQQRRHGRGLAPAGARRQGGATEAAAVTLTSAGCRSSLGPALAAAVGAFPLVFLMMVQ